MARKSTLTDAQIERICTLRENDPKSIHTWARIAITVGCTREQARYWARERGAIGPLDRVTATYNYPTEMVRRGHVVRRFTDEERHILRQAQQRNPRPSNNSLARELGRRAHSIRAFYLIEGRREALQEGA